MGTPTRLRWLFASHLHQLAKLPRPATATWQGMAFPMAILKQLIKGLQLFITSSMQHLPRHRWEHSLVCSVKHTQFRNLKKKTWPPRTVQQLFFTFFFSKQKSGDVLKSQIFFTTNLQLPSKSKDGNQRSPSYWGELLTIGSQDLTNSLLASLPY